MSGHPENGDEGVRIPDEWDPYEPQIHDPDLDQRTGSN